MSTIDLAKIKEFFIKYEQKIVLIVAFCLVSAISFEFGLIQGQKWQQKPLIIEKLSGAPEGQANGQIEPPVSLNNASSPKTQSLEPKTSSCAYVGSRSSNKFYLPTCSYAKRVKPENLVCFKTAQEAITQGRTESKCASPKQ